MAIDKDLNRLRKDQREVARKGEEWIQKYKKELSKLPSGVWVAIDVATGQYGIGNDEASATEALAEAVPNCKASYLHWVGAKAHA